MTAGYLGVNRLFTLQSGETGRFGAGLGCMLETAMALSALLIEVRQPVVPGVVLKIHSGSLKSGLAERRSLAIPGETGTPSIWLTASDGSCGRTGRSSAGAGRAKSGLPVKTGLRVRQI